MDSIVRHFYAKVEVTYVEVKCFLLIQTHLKNDFENPKNIYSTKLLLEASLS